MRKLLTIAANDLHITFSDKAVWFNIVIFPALFVVVIGVATGVLYLNRAVIVDIMDHDNSPMSRQFYSALQALNPSVTFCPSSADSCHDTPENSQQRLQDGFILALIEIPAGLEANLLAGQSVSMIYRSNEPPTTPSPVFASVQTVAQRLAGAAVAARVAVKAVEDSPALAFADSADQQKFAQVVYQQATTLWANEPGRVAYSESQQPGQLDFSTALAKNSFGQSMAGMGIYAVMVNVLIGVMVIIQERQTGTLQRLLVLPVSSGVILGGKLLTRFIMGMMAFSVALITGVILGVRLSDWLAALLVMLAFTLCMTALAFFLGTLMRIEQTARSVITLVGLLMAALGGAFWPLSIVPGWVQVIGHLSPVAWAMDGFTSLLFYGGNVQSILGPVAVLLGIAVLLFAAAVRWFSYE